MSLASNPAPLFIRKQAGKLLQGSFVSHPRAISSIYTRRLHTTSPRASAPTPQPDDQIYEPLIRNVQRGSDSPRYGSRKESTAIRRAKPKPANLDPDLRFTRRDVPCGEIWDKKREALLKDGMETDAVRLDTESCIKLATRFADEFSQNDYWIPIRAKDLKFSASDLYYMAVLLRTPPLGSGMELYMAKQMLFSAAEMGHGAAIVTNANLAINDLVNRGVHRMPERGKAPEFWKIMDRFTKYAQQAKQDPDALTVSGILAMYQHDAAKAIKLMLAAEKAGRTHAARKGDRRDPQSAGADSSSPVTSTDQMRLPRWDLESKTFYGLGLLLERTGERDAARAALCTAAYELDRPDACVRLGLLLSPDDPVEAQERERLLTRAAMSGAEAAYAPLAEMEGKKAAAAEEAGSRREAAWHRAKAEQWLSLALQTAKTGQ
ncbi:hypothetical protein PspLS_04216 [Pyricularia sp. CBS 133598]|nr:hypothetical protein PspLS_04216 [Pyricularia sp. CBS 133598]